MNTPYPVMRETIIDAALATIRTTLITETKPACIYPSPAPASRHPPTTSSLQTPTKDN